VAAHEGPLLLVEGSRLVEDRVGDRDVADVVQGGRVAQLREVVAVDPEPPRDVLDQLGDAVVVLAEVRVALGLFENQTGMRPRIAATAYLSSLTCPRVDGATLRALALFRARRQAFGQGV
jgi:hypothetical protein